MAPVPWGNVKLEVKVNDFREVRLERDDGISPRVLIREKVA